ncbi:MAG TPA: hypothetical protein VK047_13505 [Zeimonas sp.]|nr:hypothetical protein [Zeimonas sp.]
MNPHVRSPLRRTVLAACALALGTLVAGQAAAQPYGRMDRDQRERFRQQLRDRDAQRAERAHDGRGRGGDLRRGSPPSRGSGLSPAERERLREQLRDARSRDARQGGPRQGGPRQGGPRRD